MTEDEFKAEVERLFPLWARIRQEGNSLGVSYGVPFCPVGGVIVMRIGPDGVEAARRDLVRFASQSPAASTRWA
jgi:hypothetical protein